MNNFLVTMCIEWIIIIVVMIMSLLFVCTKKVLNTYTNNNLRMNHLIRILSVITFIVLIKNYFFEIYKISGKSMEDTLFSNEFVLVSKFHYGPVLSSSFWFNYPRAKGNEKNNSRRLIGFAKVKQGDIIVFHHPHNPGEIQIKRCIALPRDKLHIKESIVFINNKRIYDENSVKFSYRVWFNEELRNSFFTKLSQMGISNNTSWLNRKKNYRNIHLTKNQVDQLNSFNEIDSIAKNIDGISTHKNNLNWDKDNIGPIIIPGVNVKINQYDTSLLNNLLHYSRKDSFSDELATNFFEQNYYFMIGDNRHASHDSRHWGIVPHRNIIGKAILIVYSKKIKRIFNVL